MQYYMVMLSGNKTCFIITHSFPFTLDKWNQLIIISLLLFHYNLPLSFLRCDIFTFTIPNMLSPMKPTGDEKQEDRKAHMWIRDLPDLRSMVWDVGYMSTSKSMIRTHLHNKIKIKQKTRMRKESTLRGTDLLRFNSRRTATPKTRAKP